MGKRNKKTTPAVQTELVDGVETVVVTEKPKDASYLITPFLRECERLSSSPARFKNMILAQYEILFNEPAPANVPIPLVRAKIAYHLQVLGHVETDKAPDSKMMENYKASQTFNLNGFIEPLKGILDIQIKAFRDAEYHARLSSEDSKPEKEEKVKGDKPVKAQKVVKEKKLSSGLVILRLLLQNNVTKLTDEQIHEEVKNQCGEFNSSVSAYRSYLNKKNPKMPKEILDAVNAKPELLPSNRWDGDGNLWVK